MNTREQFEALAEAWMAIRDVALELEEDERATLAVALRGV